MPPRALFAVVWLVVTQWSCSALTTETEDCESNTECGASFGLGSVCGEDGLCTKPVVHPRCNRSFPEGLLTAPETERRVLFGTLFDSSNETHQARERAVRLALSQVNEQVKNNKEVRFGAILCSIEVGSGFPDGATTTAEAAVFAADYLTSTLELPALIGPSTSGDVERVFGSVRDLGVFVISPSATSPALSAIDEGSPTDKHPGQLWRTAPPDSLQGEVIAADLRRRNVEQVFAIYQNDSYGEGLFAIFRDHFMGKVTTRTFKNDRELVNAAVDAQAAGAKEILFIASSQFYVLDFLESIAKLDLDDTLLFLTDSAATQSVLREAPSELLPRIRGTRPAQLNADYAVFANFEAAYRSEYGADQDVTAYSFAAHSYDAAWLAMLGTAWAAHNERAISGETIARGVRQVTSGTPYPFFPSRWGGMTEAFRKGKSIDVLGTSGLLDFDPKTEELSAPVDVWTVDPNGPVLTIEYTEGELDLPDISIE